MADLGFELNANDHEQSNDFAPLPAGPYHVKIVKAEIAPTNSGGRMIKLRLDVIGPSHAGRVLFANLNIVNASEAAEKIGKQQLADIGRAIGKLKISDTDQLIGGELTAKISVTTSEKYGPGNDVKGYSALAGGTTTHSAEAKPWG